MKGQFDFTLNDNNFGLTSYVSEWFNVSGFTDFSFIAFCSVNCDQVIEYAVDRNYEIIETETYSLTGGISNDVVKPVRTRYVRFSVKNIASNPCTLQTQAFYNE